MQGFAYEEMARDGSARAGRIHTPRGLQVLTPLFMPVGTQATVKGMLPSEVRATGASILLANTYHLWLRPGAERVARLGGLHRFMRWDGGVLTDSGGFQVYSLGALRKVSDEGVRFRSHLDGSLRFLSPEEAMRVQRLLGSDIAMVLDECPPGRAERAEVEAAMRRTTRWARRCLRTERAPGQARFGIVQGGTHLDLRLAHLEEIAAMPFEGLALGGFSVGEPVERMHELLGELAPRMPSDRPRYLMGVGTPRDLIRAIGAGIDMFDCVLPTRNARTGQALTWNGRVNLKQARHAEDDRPIDPNCACPTCRHFGRAYLRHLFKTREMLGPRLVTWHNLYFYQRLTDAAREAIVQGRYTTWARETLQRMAEGDELGPPDPRSMRHRARGGPLARVQTPRNDG